MDGDGGNEAGDSNQAENGERTRHQQAGFSIFMDLVEGEDGDVRWETRLYHAESGLETTVAGISPEQWINWILERVGPGRATPNAAIEVMNVDVVDIQSIEDVTGGEASHQVTAQVIIRLTGMRSVEREIGSRLLRGIVWSVSEPNPHTGRTDRE